MNSIVLAVIVYIAWTFIKNVIKETGTPGSVTGKYNMPPIANGFPLSKDDKNVQDIPDYSLEQMDNEYSGDNFWIHPEYAEEEYDMETSLPGEETAPIGMAPISQEIIEEDVEGNLDVNTYQRTEVFNFSKQSLLNGIVMSEILGPPKSRQKKVF